MENNSSKSYPCFALRANGIAHDLVSLNESVAVRLAHAGESGQLLRLYSDIIRKLFPASSVAMSCEDDYETRIELSCNLDKLTLFEEVEFLEYLNEYRSDDLNLILSPQPISNYSMEMNGIIVTSDSVRVSMKPSESGQQFLVSLFSQSLSELYSVDESAALEAARLLLCQSLGEIPVMTYIADVRILLEYDAYSVRLDEFRAALSDALAPNMMISTAGEYLDRWVGYKSLSLLEDDPRSDVKIGTTCFIEVVDEYSSGGSDLYQRAAEVGVVLGFITCTYNRDSGVDGIEARERLLKCMHEKIGERMYRLIGTAIGTSEVFVDLLIWDFDNFCRLFPNAFRHTVDLADPWLHPFCRDVSSRRLCS